MSSLPRPCRWFVVCLALLFTVAVDASLSAAQRLITGAGVRVRAEPSAKSAEIMKLHFGDVLEQLDKSAKPETIGKKQDHWYKLRLPNGSSGWVFGGFTTDYSEDNREKIYRRIVSERLAQDTQNAADWLELFEFIDRILPTLSSKEDKPYFELGHLNALQKYLDFCRIMSLEGLESVPSIRSLASQLIYNEPGASFLISRDLYWDLFQRYREHPYADELAFAAAKQPLPGETEGYPPAIVYNIWETCGRYLEVMPRGTHAEETVTRIGESLVFTDEDLNQVKGDEIKRMKNDLSRLQKVVQSTDTKSRDATLKVIAELLKSF